MKNKTLVGGGILLTILAGAGIVLYKKCKKMSKDLELGQEDLNEALGQVITAAGQKQPKAEEPTQQVISDGAEIHTITVKKFDKSLFSNAEELLLLCCKEVLAESAYVSDMEIFNNMINTFGINAGSYSWYHFCPRTKFEFVKKLRELNLYDQYEVLIKNIYQGKHTDIDYEEEEDDNTQA